MTLLRKTDGQAECNLFKAMGLDYVYVDRGNDVAALIKAFKEGQGQHETGCSAYQTHLRARAMHRQKNTRSSGITAVPFDIETGKPLFDNVTKRIILSVTCDYLLEKMKK